LLETIHGKPGYEEFIDAIQQANTDCINAACTPTCSGVSCDIYEPKASYRCVDDAMEEITESITNPKARDIVQEYAVYYGVYYKQIKICKNNKKCNDEARRDFNIALDDFRKKMTNTVGSCISLSILNLMDQAVADCNARI